ncbi:hypothetical protein [Nocardia noduli]|uniref:hypothetical protein n=1 Tax=Nocardia noduli TaxID=2815722 RepID=UPI001C24FD7F|nr:hypothetical protein [Nocardia noduli]
MASTGGDFLDDQWGIETAGGLYHTNQQGVVISGDHEWFAGLDLRQRGTLGQRGERRRLG